MPKPVFRERERERERENSEDTFLCLKTDTMQHNRAKIKM